MPPWEHKIAGFTNHAEIIGASLDTTYARFCQNKAWHCSVGARQLDREVADTLERAYLEDRGLGNMRVVPVITGMLIIPKVKV